MKIFEEKIRYIGANKMLRIEQWRDAEGRPEFQSWRAGIEWYGEDDYEFICEYDTLDECLDAIIKYIDRKQNYSIVEI